MVELGFDDIEMLDIGDISDESISTGIPSMDSDQIPDPIVLKEWLTSSKPLEFYFNPKLYKDSVENTDKYYTEFANSNFKLLESLEDADLRFDANSDYEIGVINSNKQVGLTAKENKLNYTFLKVIEHLEILIKQLDNTNEDDGSTLEDETVENYRLLLSILDCLYATDFISDINLRPNYLCKWINRFDPQPERELVQKIMMLPKPFVHPLFWNKFISKLVERGLMDQAVSAIQNSHYEELQSSPESSVVYEVIEDFCSLLQSYNTMSLKNQFANWKLSCCEFRDLFHTFKKSANGENLRILDEIHDLLLIITGLPKTISNYSDSWYEILTTLSLYQVRDDDSLYKEYYDIATNEKPPSLITVDPYKNLEKTFLNIFERNYLHVLTKIDEIDSCTSSLISRLLELKGFLLPYYTSIDIKTDLTKSRTISEYLLTKYSFQCLNNHNLVPIGIGILLNDYIVSDSVTNKNIIASFLPNYTCKTNDELEWCLTICAKLGLINTASELYKIYGKKSLKDGYIYEALNMLVNCYPVSDSDMVNSQPDNDNDGIKEVHHIIWNIIFQDSLLNNRPIEDELINNIIEHKVQFDIHPVIRQCLSPYGVLFEFFKANNQPIQESILVKEKISKLMHLLEFIHLPKKFVSLLLSQFFVFLLNDKYIFQIPDLIVIIELIDNFESNLSKKDLETCQDLYKYAINMDITRENDWRSILKEKSTLPQDVDSLIRLLRDEIAKKIGTVYISKA